LIDVTKVRQSKDIMAVIDAKVKKVADTDGGEWRGRQAHSRGHH
jgi:hypothetical protein